MENIANDQSCPILNLPFELGTTGLYVGDTANTQCYQIIQVSSDTAQISCNTSAYHDKARCGNIMHSLYCVIPYYFRDALTCLLCECHTIYKCNPLFHESLHANEHISTEGPSL